MKTKSYEYFGEGENPTENTGLKKAGQYTFMNRNKHGYLYVAVTCVECAGYHLFNLGEEGIHFVDESNLIYQVIRRPIADEFEIEKILECKDCFDYHQLKLKDFYEEFEKAIGETYIPQNFSRFSKEEVERIREIIHEE